MIDTTTKTNKVSSGQPCAYCGKFATEANVEYSRYQLDLSQPLCFFCQQKPDRVAIFKNPELPTVTEMDMEDYDGESVEDFI